MWYKTLLYKKLFVAVFLHLFLKFLVGYARIGKHGHDYDHLKITVTFWVHGVLLIMNNS